MTKPHVAFFGLGIMGSGMARRLLTAGYPLTVFNRNPAKTAALAADGARAAGTPREAAAGADVLISMVADDDASRAVWLDEDGALAGTAPGALCVESSTVTVGWTRELAAMAAVRGCEFLDAPVTGSKIHAASGELNFLVGGELAILEKVRPILATMSKTITHAGPVSSGAMLKLINNFLCGVQVAALAEGVVMIERAGLDRARALEFLTNGAAGSPMVKTLAARISAADYTTNFPLRLMAKDLRYAIGEGTALSLDLITAAAALERYQNGVTAGHGDEDTAAVVEAIRAG